VFLPADYELIDFGGGRKLERFGPCLIVRPSPPAGMVEVAAYAERWHDATAEFQRRSGDEGCWVGEERLPKDWTVRHGSVVFQLRASPRGQVGLFAEQAENWDWITRHVQRFQPPLRVLNLFAYTGGSTLVAAAAGAEVTHIDAARSAVAWARRNAHRSGLQDAQIRWITEDARRFVDREIRRGNGYDAVVLDPPSYGHGPRGQAWRIDRDLVPLLESCAALTRGRLRFFLCTCHTPGFGPAELEACLSDAVFGTCQAGTVARRLFLRSSAGRKLPAGCAVRWPA
jgi:23S rRNA (cytosine1962-C5)-methyltransferase